MRWPYSFWLLTLASDFLPVGVLLGGPQSCNVAGMAKCFRFVAFMVFAQALFFIRLAADDPVSSLVRYNREIVRIFEHKCVSCHNEGGVGMPLETYADLRPWTRSIREEILERRMPPWPAVVGVRPLVNEMTLTTREIAIVTSWIDGGTPRGDPADLPARKAREIWPNGEPDLKLLLSMQNVPAGDGSYVRRVTISTRLTSERWLRGFDIAAGDRRVLRSAFVFVKGSDGKQHWLGGWTPWYAMTHSPFDAAYRLPRNAVLTVELHYKAPIDADQPISDASTLGLYFQSRRPAAAMSDMVVVGTPLKTDDGRLKLRGESLLRNDATIWALRPHLGEGTQAVKGSIEVKAIRPNGAIEPLLWVKENRPDLQLPYVIRDPLRLERGSRLVVTAYCEVCSPASTANVVVVTVPFRLN
jgi:hypothetical protein